MSRDSYDDLAFLLYLMPFAVSAVYALVLWAGSGLSALLPSDVYLEVTRSPYVFLLGFACVMFALVVDVTAVEAGQRSARLSPLSRRLQWMAFASFILAAVMAWYATGFLDPGAALADLVGGRYTIIFPGLLMLLSFLILPSVSIRRSQLRGLAVAVVLLAVPASVYEVGKRNDAAGLAIALVLMALGSYLLMGKSEKPSSGEG